MSKNDKPTAKKSSGTGATEKLEAAGSSASNVSTDATNTLGQEASSTLAGQILAGSPPLRIADTPAVELAAALSELADELAVHIGAVHVTARRDGYRRAGRAWSRQPTTVLLADLSNEQLLQLDDDPNVMLTPASDA